MPALNVFCCLANVEALAKDFYLKGLSAMVKITSSKGDYQKYPQRITSENAVAIDESVPLVLIISKEGILFHLPFELRHGASFYEYLPVER